MGGGGAERQLTYLARELTRSAWDVHVAVIQGGPNVERLEESGATIHRIRASGNHDPLILARLLRTIRRVQPDVVQCWLRQMEIAGGIAAALSGTPWVFCERAAPDAYPPGFKTWLRAKVAAWSTAIVSNSSIGDHYWQMRTGARPTRYVIPNGLPLDEIAAAPIAASANLGLKLDARLVLMAGRLEAEKNVPALVRAIRLVNQTRPVQMILCGDGSLRASVLQLIESEGLTDRIRLTGYVTNLWSLLKRADVVVSPSVFEGNPNVVLEAMACGSPLVVSDIPAHRELLDERTAMFVTPVEPRSLADAIAAVLNDPGAAADRAQGAQVRAQRYSLQAVARQYADVYRAIATRGGRIGMVVS
jgi:glycosyltransferase involved in cell wall biosynthesis